MVFGVCYFEFDKSYKKARSQQLPLRILGLKCNKLYCHKNSHGVVFWSCVQSASYLPTSLSAARYTCIRSVVLKREVCTCKQCFCHAHWGNVPYINATFHYNVQSAISSAWIFKQNVFLSLWTYLSTRRNCFMPLQLIIMFLLYRSDLCCIEMHAY